MVAVPEFDPSAAASAQSSAKVLLAAQEHLGSLLAQVHAAVPLLESCKLTRSSPRNQRLHGAFTSLVRSTRSADREMVKKSSMDAVAFSFLFACSFERRGS